LFYSDRKFEIAALAHYFTNPSMISDFFYNQMNNKESCTPSIF
jgi:hypothetical protein